MDGHVEGRGRAPQLGEIAFGEDLEPLDVEPGRGQREVIPHVLHVRVDHIVGHHELHDGTRNRGRLVQQSSDRECPVHVEGCAEIVDHPFDIRSGQGQLEVEWAPRRLPRVCRLQVLTDVIDIRSLLR